MVLGKLDMICKRIKYTPLHIYIQLKVGEKLTCKTRNDKATDVSVCGCVLAGEKKKGNKDKNQRQAINLGQ